MAAKLKKRALAEYNSQVVHVDPQLQEKRLKITGGDSRYELKCVLCTVLEAVDSYQYIFGRTARRFFRVKRPISTDLFRATLLHLPAAMSTMSWEAQLPRPFQFSTDFSIMAQRSNLMTKMQHQVLQA